MKTKAAILIEQHRDLEIEEIEVPKLEYGQVLVELKSSRVCGSQLGEIDGVKGVDRWLPHLLGHEGGGVVLETGPEVKTVKEGDRVVLHWRPGRGINSSPPKYYSGDRIINAGYVTTFNNLAVVSENRLTPVPKECSFDLCSLLADVITTGFGAINNNANLKIGQSIVIVGCGGIGLGAVLGAHLAGGHPIIAVDIFDHKLYKAEQFGANEIINSYQKNMHEEVLKLTGEMGPDVVIECTGNPNVIEQSFNMLHPQGCCVLLGVMSFDRKLSLNTLPMHFGKRLVGTEGGQSQPDIEIPKYLKLLEARNIDVTEFITHRYRLDEINQAIQSMRSGDSVNTIIEF